MIPSKSGLVTQTGTLPGKKTPMTVSAEHMPHIINILTKQYSDIIAAILREYSANAWDSHVRAGKTDTPIQVRTPDRYHPYLEIQDFGLGMSVEFVENEFSQYGVSTKRGDNVEAGAFGIGGKSALAYTESFQMTTVKDGEKGLFSIGYNEDGAPEIVTVGVESTTQPNGVLVSIPAKSNDDFDERVDWFYRFWKPGTVLVNGEAPKPIKAQKLTDDLFYTPEEDASYVVMGNLPYKIKNLGNFLPYTFQKFSFIAYLPVGAVPVVPSRENLEYGDETTTRELKAIGQTVKEKMIDHIKAEILASPTHYAAWARWDQWRKAIGVDHLKDLTYKGDLFTDKVEGVGWKWSPRGRRGRSVTRVGTISTGYNANILNLVDLDFIIVKNPCDEPNSYNKQKAKWFASEQGLHPSSYLFLDKVPESPWVEGFKTYTWEEVKKAKNPTQALLGPRDITKGKVPVLTEYGYWSYTEISDLPDDKPLLLITPQHAKSVQVANLVAGMTKFEYDVMVVKLPANRWNKFKREHKNAESIDDWMKIQSKILLASIPDETYELKGLGDQTRVILGNIGDYGKVVDPDLHKLIGLQRTQYQKYMNEYTSVFNFMGCLGLYPSDGDRVREDWVVQKYPLLGHLDRYRSFSMQDAIIDYINMKYERDSNGSM